MNKKFKKVVAIALCGLVGVSFTGCAPKLGGDDYTVNEVGAAASTYYGVVTNVRAIAIGDRDNVPGTGAALGGVGGAVLGSTIGGGRGRMVTGVLGGVLGAVAGHFAGQALTNQTGFQYTVKLDNGEIMTISQGAEPKISVGQKVAVMINKTANGGSGRSRVMPA